MQPYDCCKKNKIEVASHICIIREVATIDRRFVSPVFRVYASLKTEICVSVSRGAKIAPKAYASRAS